MDFDRDWHTFSLDAEVDAYGTSRIAGAHNRLREENARLTEKLARCVEALLEIRGRALASQTHEIGPLEAKERLAAVLVSARAALAAVKGE